MITVEQPLLRPTSGRRIAMLLASLLKRALLLDVLNKFLMLVDAFVRRGELLAR